MTFLFFFINILPADEKFSILLANHCYCQTDTAFWFAYEVCAAVLPKIDCTGSGSVSVARSSKEDLFITLLVKNGGQGNFLINNNSGIIMNAQFSVVPGTSGQWYFAKVFLLLFTFPNGSKIKIDNTTNLFQMGFL